MTRFIETEEGWINLATIGRFDQLRRPEGNGGGWGWYAWPIEGEGRYSLYDTFDPDHTLARIIPAGYPMHVAVLGCASASSEPPTLEDVWVELQPVVAWRLEYGIATPILTVAVEDNDLAIPLGDGRWQTDGENVHDDLDALKAIVHGRALDSWQTRQAQEEP